MADSSSKLQLPKAKATQPKGSRRAGAVVRAPLAGGPAAGLPDTQAADLPDAQAAEPEAVLPGPAAVGRIPAVDAAPTIDPAPAAALPDAAPAVRPDITQLVLEYHEVLYRYAYRLTGSAADAEDLTQQTFLVAHEKLGQVRAADCVQSWLFTVLRNAYLKNRRRLVPLNAGNLALDLDTVFDKNTTAPADERPIDSDELQRALGELADEFKLVLLLFYFEERSYREIAEILRVPPGTVMSRLSRAKAHLRSKLFPSDREAIHAGKVVP